MSTTLELHHESREAQWLSTDMISASKVSPIAKKISSHHPLPEAERRSVSLSYMLGCALWQFERMKNMIHDASIRLQRDYLVAVLL